MEYANQISDSVRPLLTEKLDLLLKQYQEFQSTNQILGGIHDNIKMRAQQNGKDTAKAETPQYEDAITKMDKLIALFNSANIEYQQLTNNLLSIIGTANN